MYKDIFSFKEQLKSYPNVYKGCTLLKNVGAFKKDETFYAIGVEDDEILFHFFQKRQYIEEIGCASLDS